MQKDTGKSIRSFLVNLHKTYLTNLEDMRRAAEVCGLSISTVNQAVVHGKGSAVTHGLLICYGMGIKSENLDSYLPKFKKVFTGSEKLSTLDERIQKVLKHYSVDELIAWLELLLAKNRIEENLGVRKKVGRPKGSRASE